MSAAAVVNSAGSVIRKRVLDAPTEMHNMNVDEDDDEERWVNELNVEYESNRSFDQPFSTPTISTVTSLTPNVKTAQCSMTTTTISGSSLPKMNENTRGSCIVWIHLQASICTEWEQSSMTMLMMMIGPGPRTTTSSAAWSLSQESLQAERILNFNHQTKPQKKPQTIHRCILRRGRKNNPSRNGSSLKCHVCGSGYSTYHRYFGHLMDSTCAKKKEAKDVRAAAASIVIASVATTTTTEETNSRQRQRSAETPLPRLISVCEGAMPLNLTTGGSIGDQLKEESRDPLLTTTALCHGDWSPLPSSAGSSKGSWSDSEPSFTFRESGSKRSFNEETLALLSSFLLDSATSHSRRKRKLHDDDDKTGFGLQRKTRQFLSQQETKSLLRNDPISLVDHATDQANLANLKVHVAKLIVAGLGEARLSMMGYPEADILDILRSVLESAKMKPLTVVDIDRQLGDDGKTDPQSKLRKLRKSIYAAKVNIKLLLYVCIPDHGVWRSNGWDDDKPLESILCSIVYNLSKSYSH